MMVFGPAGGYNRFPILFQIDTGSFVAVQASAPAGSYAGIVRFGADAGSAVSFFARSEGSAIASPSSECGVLATASAQVIANNADMTCRSASQQR